MKRCSKCLQEYPETTEFFYKTKYGLNGQCIACRKAYLRDYYKAHSEEIKSHAAEWAKGNHDKRLAIQRRYRESNRDLLRDKSRQYMRLNWRRLAPDRETLRRRHKAWRDVSIATTRPAETAFVGLGCAERLDNTRPRT